jgi:hypothetical protein
VNTRALITYCRALLNAINPAAYIIALFVLGLLLSKIFNG